MNRQKLLDHLAQAERQVVRGKQEIAWMSKLIEQRERDGHDIAAAIQLHKSLLELQALHVAALDRLRKKRGELEAMRSA